MGERNAPLPKFGEWDVKNPAAAKDFSVIFDKARNAKRNNGIRPPTRAATRRDQLDSPARKQDNNHHTPSPNSAGAHHFIGGLAKPLAGRKWLCCVGRRHSE